MLTRSLLLAALLALYTTHTQALDPVANDLPLVNLEYPPAIQELTLLSSGQRMPGILYQANGAGPHPTVVLLHGLPGNEKNLDIAQVLRRAGFNVLFFHYRGAWGAEGVYSFSHVVEDVGAVLAWLRVPENAASMRVDPSRLSTLGHSLGGYASLAAGARDPQLMCVGAMAAANLGVMAAGIKAGDPGMMSFIDYADSLYMLRGFDGAALRANLENTPMDQLDTTLFARGLSGKSVFLVAGSEDRVTPPALMFTPVVTAYLKQPGIDLHHNQIPGDHSFSRSRIQLTRLLLDWFQNRCR
jgi:pimeloyl-ACP methyl ester carboxylesterase